MKLTEFKFFKDTQLNDFQNTIHFPSNSARDNHFLNGGFYPTVSFDYPFNFIRDRLQLKAMIAYEKMDGVNYCTFINQRDNIRYYAFVTTIKYLNDKVTQVDLVIDGIMTFLQGKKLNELKNIHVMREHLPKSEYDARSLQLRTNGDVLKTTTKSYVYSKQYRFSAFRVIFTSSVDLSEKFGKEDSPTMNTSTGQTFDKLTSPLNLYVTNVDQFQVLMKELKPFPWIAQNITKIMMIPSDFVDFQSLENVTMKEGNFKLLYKFPNKGRSKNFDLTSLNMSMVDITDRLRLNSYNEKHLLRSEYTTLEVYSYDGQQLLLDTAFLDDVTGLKFKAMTSIGYNNQVAVFPLNYKTTPSEQDVTVGSEITVHKGSFLNNAIVYSNFDEIPVLIDNYSLAMAKGANRRQLAEDKLVTNRIENIADPKADLKDRFFNSVSMVSNLNPSSLFGKFNDEYEYYRSQKAEFADLALSSPTITSQTNNNSFNLANDIYGLTIKMSAPNDREWEKVKKYYKTFGYEIEEMKSLENVESMTICNYVQVKGNMTFKGVDNAIVEQMKAQLENGVRLWHDNGTGNPMSQNIMSNVMKS